MSLRPPHVSYDVKYQITVPCLKIRFNRPGKTKIVLAQNRTIFSIYGFYLQLPYQLFDTSR